MPVVFAGFFLIARKSHQGSIAWLGLASIFFYSYWSIAALPIMVVSICINYWFGLLLSKPNLESRKTVLTMAIIANLLALGYFKYANFFIANTNSIREIMGADPLEGVNVALPIGISFFTFTQIAFLVDTYKNKVKEQSFLKYVLFVSFFPHLLAGPVIHHKQMMPQFSDSENFQIQKDKIALGFVIFTIGLAKKVLIADSLSGFVSTLFNSIAQDLVPNFWVSWIGSLCYTFQMYFDFSGYSDMAVGLSLLFGIWLPFNFNSPLKATNIIEFWQRWHMSLTKYISEYLYNPLSLIMMRIGMGKKPFLDLIYTLVFPTIAVMLIVGLWHGANWTFVVFGGMHGVFLVVNHTWRKRKMFIRPKNSKPTAIGLTIGWIITFSCVMLALVMFRSDTINTAIEIYKGMMGLNGFYMGPVNEWLPKIKLELFLIAVSFIIIFFMPNSLDITAYSKKETFNKEKWIYPSIVICLVSIYLLSILTKYQASPFLYFEF